MDNVKKVLVVEDNDLNSKLFKDILDAHGYKTIEIHDGRKAVIAAKKETPDLIVMDIQLPHVSGIDLIKQLKSIENLKKIPIIAVTAFAMQDDEKKILDAGCEEYIAKPIQVSEFVEAIQKYLDVEGGL